MLPVYVLQHYTVFCIDVIKLVFGNDDKNNLEKTILIVQARRMVKRKWGGGAITIKGQYVLIQEE